MARVEIALDGNAYASASTRTGTVGRGSSTNSSRTTTQSVTTRVARKTTRWRKRRYTTRTRTVAQRSVMTAAKVVSSATSLAASVSAELRASANQDRTAWSAVWTTSVVATRTLRPAPRSSTAARTQIRLVQRSSRGRGGGSPDGRRRTGALAVGGIVISCSRPPRVRGTHRYTLAASSN